MQDARTARMENGDRTTASSRLSELSAQERARLGTVWGALPPHIFEQMVDRLARLRLAREQGTEGAPPRS
jgi:hypothetical protein